MSLICDNSGITIPILFYYFFFGGGGYLHNPKDQKLLCRLKKFGNSLYALFLNWYNKIYFFFRKYNEIILSIAPLKNIYIYLVMSLLSQKKRCVDLFQHKSCLKNLSFDSLIIDFLRTVRVIISEEKGQLK